MRRTKHGFWDEEFKARIDTDPFPSAEDEFFFEEPEPEDFCGHDELYEALNHLTARQCFVIRLFYGFECEPFTVQEIADLMRWHHSTVREHLAAAQKRLGKLLDTPQNDH